MLVPRMRDRMTRASDRKGSSPARRQVPGTKKAAPSRAGRRRLSAEARQRTILTEAIRFFAEEGFEGQTRALAQRLGITHSLLYRHFAGKDDLIERVYREVYLGRWRPQWRLLLGDRTMPFEVRLKSFYRVYTEAIFDRHWVRIFIFAGLKGVDINTRYMAIIEKQVLRPICLELRAEAGLADADDPVTSEELEMVWGLHGRIFSLAIRKWVYSVPMPRDLDATIDGAVEIFLRGALPPSARSRAVGNGWAVHLGKPVPAVAAVQAATHVKTGRKRMQPEDRVRNIVDVAVRFFAERGFEGQMRELARQAGMTHSLLYRYFPTKDALIERVYEEVYVGRWQPEWDALLHDATRPLEERLVRFYRDYAEATDHYEWLRIFMLAGLRGVNITRRYLALVRRRVIVPIASALRQAAGPAAVGPAPPSPAELEAAWGIHEQIVYVMIRRWVYGLRVPGDMDGIIATLVAGFVAGAPSIVRDLARHRAEDAGMARRAMGGRADANVAG